MSAVARHVIRSTGSNLAGQVLILGTWFLLTPFIVHELGPTDYGLWALVASIVAYGGLLDLGIGGAVTKYVAELRPQGRADEASQLTATAFRMYCFLGALVAALAVPIAIAVPSLFHLPPAERSTAFWVVLLAALALAVNLPATTAYAVLRGLQRFDLANLISVLATLTQAAATVVVLHLGGGIVALAALSVPLILLTQVALRIVIRRIAPDLRIGWYGAERRSLATVASFSSALFVMNAAGAVKTKTDEIVIAGALALANVTPYAIARRVSELPTILTYQFVRVLFPLASEMGTARDKRRLADLFVSSTRLALGLFAPIGIALIVFAEPFLRAWVGLRYAGDDEITVILIAAAAIDVVMWPAASVLQGTGRHRRLALFGAGSALLNLALSVVLVRSMGVVGVALGTLIAAAVEVAFVLPYAVARLEVRARRFALEALVPSLLPVVPAGATLIALRTALHPASLPAIVFAGAVGGAVYATTYLMLSASAPERSALLRVATGLRRTTAAAARARFGG